MQRILMVAVVVSLVVVGMVQAASVDGYWRQNGTYVQPYQRTLPNSTIQDNYSFPGNYNPNSGQITPGDPWKALQRELTLPQAPTLRERPFGR